MTDDGPKCDKCGLPITTGLMAVFCPLDKECEFWPGPLHQEFIDEFRRGMVPAYQPGELSK